MKNTFLIVALASALAVVGCKKKSSDATTTDTGSGSGSSMTMAGSGSSMTMAGSGSADGSAAMVGSGGGSAAMAGSGSDADGPPRPASVTDAMIATADKAIDQMVKLGADLQATGGDCKKATAAISAAAPGISASIAEMEKMKPDADPAAKEWFKWHYATKADPMGEAMEQVIAKCKDDKDFMDAVKKLGMIKKKDAAPPPPMKGSAEPAK